MMGAMSVSQTSVEEMRMSKLLKMERYGSQNFLKRCP